MAETTTSQNEHLRIMPTAEGQAATSQAVFLSTRPTIPKSGFYRDGTMSPYARRKIRMQEDWDKQRAAQIEEARVFQQMELQRKQFEIQSRDQQLQEDQFYFDREAAVAEQKLKAQKTSEAREFLGAVNSLDPRSSDYRDNLIQLRRQYPLGSLDETVAAVVDDYDKVHSVYMDSLAGQEAEQEEFYSTQQSLLESGVPQEKLSEYYDPKAPAGVTRFDQDAVSKQLGTTKFQKEEAAKEKDKEAPKNKINFDLRQAYGELNELLLSGEATESARAKVAGLRERYKAVTGEEAPEVLPRPTSGEQYDRLPNGTRYIGKDGKIKTKTAKIKRKK